MDAIATLLDGPRARQAFLLRSSMNPPWSIRVADEAPLTVVALVRGSAHLISEGGAPAIQLEAGDVAIVRGPDHYTIADDPSTEPQALVHPDDSCTRPDGSPLTDLSVLGVRTWGNARDGETQMITGTYRFDGEVSRRLLQALPSLVWLRADEWDCPVVPLLAEELIKDEPGQEAVLDRLLDLLVIAALRAWFARPEAEQAGWYRAHSDPIVGQVLRLIHHEPSRHWTVAALAAEVGVSRAALARRFQALVGEPPLAFLTGWRIALAADLLLEPGATIGSVAQQVGYSTPYALSTAFKRVRGVSPKEHRARAFAT